MVYVALRACAHACKQSIHAAGFHLENCKNRVFGWEAVFTVFFSKACFDTEAGQKLGTCGFSGMSRQSFSECKHVWKPDARSSQWRVLELGALCSCLGGESWFGHGCSGQRMLWEHERNYGLGMNALVTVCSWNPNGIMVLAWMLWSAYALGTRTELWFGHGCSGHRMLLEPEWNYGFGMDALVSVCSWNTNGIMVWAWMLWSAYALGTRTELWFGHGCSGQRMLLEHERNYGFGVDALVSVCSWNTNGIMVWAWMLWSVYALGTPTESWFGRGCSGQRDAVGRRTSLLALTVFRESRKLQKCSIHRHAQRKQAP